MPSAKALEPDLEAWGDRIAERRRELDLSQAALAAQVAKLTGQIADQSLISKLERGKRSPTDRQKTALARLLKTTVWALFPYPDDGR